MDQIHLSPLVDQIQLALGHISNKFKSNKQTRRRRRGESLRGKSGGTGFAKPVAPVLGGVVIPL
jgi:hypothetical protein